MLITIMFPKNATNLFFLWSSRIHNVAERAHLLKRLLIATKNLSSTSQLVSAAHQLWGRVKVSGSCRRRAVLIGIRYKGQDYNGQPFELPASHSGVKIIKELLIYGQFFLYL